MRKHKTAEDLAWASLRRRCKRGTVPHIDQCTERFAYVLGYMAAMRSKRRAVGKSAQ